MQTLKPRCALDSPINSPINNPLITSQKNQLYHVIDEHENEILNELLRGKCWVIEGWTSPYERKKTILLSLETHPPLNVEKNEGEYTELNIINTLKQKIEGSKLRGEKKTPKKTYDTTVDIRKIREFYIGAKGKNDFITKKSFIGFIKNVLCKKDPEKYYQQCFIEGRHICKLYVFT